MLVILSILSLLIFALPRRYKFAYIFSIIVLGALLACTESLVYLAGDMLPQEYTGGSSPFSFGAPVMDPLSAVFLIVISLCAVSVTAYSKDYVEAYSGTKPPVQVSLHYVSLAALCFSMMFVVMFRGAFAFLFSWELMTIASFLLILFDGEKREIRRAAINYLVLMHVGFIFILTAFVVSSGDGSLGGFNNLAAYFATNNPLPVFLLFFIGFGMKAGIFPLHIWLPEAHPAAPSHVSALMSGVMIKMGVYGMMRVAIYITGDQLYTMGMIMLVAGLVTSVWGIIFASLQNDLKKLLAYSSIENIGIIFTAMGLGVVGRATGNDAIALLGFAGAILHTINHSLFKPILFMSAGSVYLSTHTRNIDELGGLSSRMPITSLLFLVGSVAICALPPFNGFVSEFLIYLGIFKSIGAGAEVLASVVAAATLSFVGGMAVLVFSKAFGIGFLGTARCCKAENAREATLWMLCAQMLPLAGIVLIGIFPQPFTRAAANVVSAVYGTPSEFYEAQAALSIGGVSAVMLIFIVLGGTIYFLKNKALSRRIVRNSPTWGCGFTAPNKRMQYTGESFSEGIQRLTASLSRNRGKEGDVPKDEIFASKREFGVEHGDKVDRMVSDKWMLLVRKINARMSFFQTGKINHYILHALLFLVLTLLLTFTGII